MNVCRRGRGFPIGDPYDMSLTKTGKRWAMFKLCSTHRHPTGMYGVVCIYRKEPSSVSGASSCAVCGVAAEGAGVGTMCCGGVSAVALDVVDNADCRSILVNETTILPVGYDRTIRPGVTCIGAVAKGATPEA